MELYFAPLACSLATRIALYEAGAAATFTQVDTRAKRVADGSDFFAVNAMGQVPVLRGDGGETLTENPGDPAIRRRPLPGIRPCAHRRLRALPAAAMAELRHLGAAQGRLHPAARPAGAGGRQGVRTQQAAVALAYLDHQLAGRDYLLDRFTSPTPIW